jgi:hypothetical protein
MVSRKILNARVVERARRLREQLDTAPVVQVTGVVSPPGAGGASSPGQKLWTLLFTLESWRINDSAAQDRPLMVERQVSRKEFKELQRALKPYAVVRLAARVVVKTEVGTPRASMERFVGLRRGDMQLSQQSAALQKPVTFADAALGTFTLDRDVDWFSTRARWKGKLIALCLSATAPNAVKKAVKIAHTLWEKQNDWDKQTRAFAGENLLLLKNDNWLDVGEQELNGRQFAARMRLKSIVVRPDGTVDFWHDDGGLFRGHSILVAGTLKRGPKRAEIAG